MQLQTFSGIVSILTHGTIPTHLIHYWWKEYKTDVAREFTRDLRATFTNTILLVGSLASVLQSIVYGLTTKTLDALLQAELWPALVVPGMFLIAGFLWLLPFNGVQEFGVRLQRFIAEYIALERQLQEAPAGKTPYERAQLHLAQLRNTIKNPADGLRLETCTQVYQAFGLVGTSETSTMAFDPGTADMLG